MKKFYAILLLAIALIASDTEAQRLSPRSRLVLKVDYARYRNDDTSGYVEVYYGYFPELISLDQHDGNWHGLLKVTTRVKDVATGQYLVDKSSLVPVAITDTSKLSMRSTLVSQAGFVLPFGKYDLEVIVVDSLAPQRKDTLSRTFWMRTYGSVPGISDLELCSNVKSSDRQEGMFIKNSLEAIPNPTLAFGIATHPMMFHYAEMYNLDPQKTYTVKTQILAEDATITKESTKQRKYGLKNTVEAGMMNVASIPSGRYIFRLELGEESGAPIIRSQKTILLLNPHVHLVEAKNVLAMTNLELCAEFEKAEYVATKEEIKAFSMLTSEYDRRMFLVTFWEHLQNGRPDRQSFKRAPYLLRVTAADQRYRTITRDGWKTDRGRVFIVYGEPDEIERFPASSENKSYEIWHYYSIENGVEFDFVDRMGVGDYRLVNSTKLGELRDTDWQGLTH